MKETVKFNQGIPRNQVLLLSQLIDVGLKSDEAGIRDLLSAMPQDTTGELKQLAEDFLEKAGLKELSAKLKSYHAATK